MSSDQPAPPPMHTSPRQALLGMFILFQIAFLITANMLGFVRTIPDQLKDRPLALVKQAAPGFAANDAHGHQWSERIETAVTRLAQLTGQEQGWQLYTPTGKNTGFPVVVLLWDEADEAAPIIKGAIFAYDEKNGFHLGGSWNPSPPQEPSLTTASYLGVLAATSPHEALHLSALARLRAYETPSRVEVILSDNEPRDLDWFIRYSHCRLRRFEGQFYVNFQPEEDETPIALAERLTGRTRKFVRDWNDPALQYMKWRLAAWQKNNPDAPAPKQVLLLERFYAMQAPLKENWNRRGWDGPVVYPIARWQPDRPQDGTYRLEPFDYSEQRFFPYR
jgi:hypothetical protein